MDIYKWYKAERVLYIHHILVFPQIIKGIIRIMWGGGNPLSGRHWRRNRYWLSGPWYCNS